MIRILNWDNPQDIQKLIASVEQQDIFIGTTDTVLGIMADVSLSALKKIDNVKLRRDKPYVILVDSMSKVASMCVIKTAHLRRFLQVCWPGPVTIILPKLESLPDFIGSASTIALRIPDHKGLQKVLSNLEYGLYSTSANVSGEPIPYSFDQVAQRIKDSCQYYIHDDLDVSTPLASTIIQCSGNTIELVRPGLYPIERLFDLYREVAD